MDGSSWWRESARPAAEAWRKSSAWTRWLSKDSASLAVEERPWIGARRASMVAEVPPPRSLLPAVLPPELGGEPRPREREGS